MFKNQLKDILDIWKTDFITGKGGSPKRITFTKECSTKDRKMATESSFTPKLE